MITQTVKLTNSGQISLPKQYRDRFNTNLFEYQIIGNQFTVKPLIIDRQITDLVGTKYTLKDLEKAIFTSKNKKEKDLASKIDEILYQ